MKFKGIKILAISVLIVTVAAGCSKKKEIIAEVPQDNKESVSQNTKIDITDQTELEKLWQEYFYDSIASIGNVMKFDSPEEIDPVYIARFAWFKYQREQDITKLEFVKDSSLTLLPMDKVLECAKKYFDLTTLDISKLSNLNYDTEKKAFIVSGFGNRNPPSYNDINSWGINLDKVTRNGDGTVTAVMVGYDTYENKRVESTNTFTLKEREDGSLYFISGKQDYIDNINIAVTGDYTHSKVINGFEGNMQGLSMVGEIGGKLILAYTSYDNKNTGALMIVNPDTYTVDKSLKSDDNFGFSDVRQSGNCLMAYTKNKAILISKDLEILNEISLPEIILDKINREPKFDSNNLPDVYFGGYDISRDLKKLAYSDEKGLMLYDFESKKEELISKTIEVVGRNMDKYSYHSMPRFIADDKKIISTMTGYEWSNGYTLYDLELGSSNTVNAFTEDIFSDIHYDTGLLKINLSVEDEKTKKSEKKDIYLNFKTGNMTEVKLADKGETGEIRENYLCYVGQYYGAFVTYKYDLNDFANNIYYINRLDLKTLEVEPKIISVKGAEIHILGVTESGKIAFWYSRHPGDYEICITKKAKLKSSKK